MGEPFIGSEAVAAGKVSHSQLRRAYTRVFRDVYVSENSDLNPAVRAKAAWLWSRCRGVIAGFSASALYGSRWIDATAPAELLHDNRHRLPGLLIRGDRCEPDEIAAVDGVAVTIPARTALDLACWYPTMTAVAGIDALSRACECKVADAITLGERYPGRRGVARARVSLDLVDAGAQSPKESWLRLLLIRAGLPRPQTQIPICDEFGDAVAYLDMGWEDVKVAVEYDGDHHRTARLQYNRDIRRHELLQRRGWIIVRVTADDSRGDIVRRARAALARRA
jgi:hypothetical protein